MRLDELFGNDDAMTETERLRQAALDLLIPLVGQKVPFVTVQTIIDQLRQMQPGILVDRALLVKILDPDVVKAVSKIEGDRIYLASNGDEDISKENEDEATKNIQKVKDAAIQQAQKKVKNADAVV